MAFWVEEAAKRGKEMWQGEDAMRLPTWVAS